MKKDMENNKYKNHGNRVWSGLILLIIGTVFLLRNFGFYIPYWIFSWPTLLILIGLVIGFKRKFNGGGWLVMVLVGGYFTLQNIMHFNLTQYYIGAGFVVLGLYIILKPARPDHEKWKWKRKNYNWNDPLHQQNPDPAAGNYAGENDFIDAVNVFAGSKRQVYSKDLKGGDIVSVFGGCDLDLTQADFQDNVTIDIVAIFGGVKLIIPPKWVVKSEVSAIFGGMEDKRNVIPVTDEPFKILTIKGVALFGGVSISNY